MKDRIRLIRETLGMTQQAFASKIGVGRSSIAKLESGENKPSDQTIKLICSEFNVNAEYLKDGADVPMFLESCGEDEMVERIMMGADDFKKSVFRAFARLGDQEWQLLEKIVHDIKKTGPGE